MDREELIKRYGTPPFYDSEEQYKEEQEMEINFSGWVEKVHPIRALLAIASIAATIFFLVSGIAVPGEWWIIVTGLCLYYVESLKKQQ